MLLPKLLSLSLFVWTDRFVCKPVTSSSAGSDSMVVTGSSDTLGVDLDCINEDSINAVSQCNNGAPDRPNLGFGNDRPLRPTATNESSVSQRPTSSVSHHFTAATSISDCNYLGCRFPPSPCPDGRCLQTATHEKGIEAVTNFVYWERGFLIGGILDSLWDTFKTGWNLVTHPVQTANIAVRIFMASHDPVGSVSEIMLRIVKNCKLTNQADPDQLLYLKQCIIESTREVANEIGRTSRAKYDKCFHTDAQSLGKCTGEAVFQVAIVIAGPGELRAAKDLEEISVQIMTNELEESELIQAKKTAKMLACPRIPLGKRGLSPSCVEDIGNVEKRVVINADTKTPLEKLYKGTYLMASTPSRIDFPKGTFLTEGATLLGEGETGLAFLNKLNDEMVVVKVPRFTPSIEKQFKIDNNYFIVGKSTPNEKEAVKLQGLFVDEKILDDGRSIIAMKVAPGITLKDFIRGGNIKTKKELEVLFDSTFKAMQKMWSNEIIHNDLHKSNFMVKKNPIGDDYIVTIIDYGNADLKLPEELFLKGKNHDRNNFLKTFKNAQEYLGFEKLFAKPTA